MTSLRCDRTEAWAALRRYFDTQGRAFELREAFAQDAARFAALYEHRVFASGAVWGINSFDQWGVELGKTPASNLLPRLASGDAAGLDASTAGLLARLRPTPR